MRTVQAVGAGLTIAGLGLFVFTVAMGVEAMRWPVVATMLLGAGLIWGGMLGELFVLWHQSRPDTLEKRLEALEQRVEHITKVNALRNLG